MNKLNFKMFLNIAPSIMLFLLGIAVIEIKSTFIIATVCFIAFVTMLFQVNIKKMSDKVLTSTLSKERDELINIKKIFCNALSKIDFKNKELIKILDKSKLENEDIKRIKKSLLNNICGLLQIDSRKSTSSVDYFKATLFKVISPNHLKHDESHCPPGTSTRTTDMRIIKSKPETNRITSFIALRTKQMQIIEDVKKEEKKPNGRWISLYPGQSKLYESMISIPIFIGERTEESEEVVAILTVDTNRKKYFDEGLEYKSFWPILFAPFRSQLSMIYTLENAKLKEET